MYKAERSFTRVSPPLLMQKSIGNFFPPVYMGASEGVFSRLNAASFFLIPSGLPEGSGGEEGFLLGDITRSMLYCS